MKGQLPFWKNERQISKINNMNYKVMGCLKMSKEKPLPNTKGISEVYWEALNSHQFLIQVCDNCQKQIFYPRVVCPFCSSSDIHYEEHSGKGTLYSDPTIHSTGNESFKSEVPYTSALSDLEGGGRMMSRIVRGQERLTITIGSPVKVCYEEITDDVTLPYFYIDA